MRVLLVNPPSPDGKLYLREVHRCSKRSLIREVWPQTSIAGMAALLEREGFEADVLDCIALGMAPSALLEGLAAINPDMAILLVSTATFSSDAGCARAIKKIFRIPVGAIGYHATALPKESLSAGFDFVVHGESEMAILEICRKGTYAIPSVSYLKDGKVHMQRRAGEKPELDSLPFPALSKLPLKKYSIPFFDGNFSTIAVSRGCRHRCTFCRSRYFHGGTCRFRSVENVMRELSETLDDYRIRNFVFMADTFTGNKDWVLSLCERIREERLDIKWACNSRVDTFDAETANAIKRAGCRLVTFGVESGEQKLLDAMRKGITPAQSVAAVRKAKKAGLLTAGYFMLGYPGETSGSLKKTMALARAAMPHMPAFYFATPYPGTRFFSICKREGLIRTFDWAHYDNGASYVLKGGHVSETQLRAAKRNSMLQGYLAPKYLGMLAGSDFESLQILFRCGFSYLQDRLS